MLHQVQFIPFVDWEAPAVALSAPPGHGSGVRLRDDGAAASLVSGDLTTAGTPARLSTRGLSRKQPFMEQFAPPPAAGHRLDTRAMKVSVEISGATTMTTGSVHSTAAVRLQTQSRLDTDPSTLVLGLGTIALPPSHSTVRMACIAV
jgi:hypothetical protein